MQRLSVLIVIFYLLCIAIGPCGLAAESSQPEPVTKLLYVDTKGNDSWSGTSDKPNEQGTDGPFANVTRAQKAIAARRSDGRLPGPVTVLIRGTHYLTAPIVFTPQDSGTARHPITYAACPGETPVLSGGRRISGWRKGDGGRWTVQLPDVKAGKWYFRQLFVDGKRVRRARFPNEENLHVQSLAKAEPKARWNQGVDRFRFFGEDIKPWNDLHNVEVVVYHSWNTSRVRIAAVDTDERVVTFTGPTVFRPLAWDPEQRYYVENALELLDAPGEWYLDRKTGTLHYWPLPGQDMTKVEVIAPALQDLLRFQGDADAGQFVEHIHVARLSFQHADWSLSDKGYGDPQAAVTVPAAVSATGARHCVVERCEVAHVGGYGIWLSRGCKDNRIDQNHIHDLGAGGVRLGEAKMAATDETESSHNVILNNYLHDGGHVYAGAVGLWLAQSSHNRIAHNEIHSFNYSGMSIGWNWNDAPNRTHHNIIEHNHIHHVVRGLLSDAGGIYNLGTQIGSMIRNNLIHDVFPYSGKPAMAWGIYLDQGTNGLLIENNIVYHTLTGGIMNTASPRNVIRNNIFALNAQNAAWRWAWQKEPPTVFERNIIYLTQGSLFHNDGGRTDNRSRWDSNLFWRTDGQPLEFYEDDFEAWQARGLGRHSLIADPQFVDADRFDFRLKPDSPALKLGFQPIDINDNGLQGSPEWVGLPRQAIFPPTVLPSPPPPPKPVPVNDGFEETPVKEPPTLVTLYEEGRGDSIRVTDEVAATGKHSLKFTDAAGLQHVWDPHLHYTPHFRQGRVVLSFDLSLSAGAIVGHEWRDAAAPYRAGPSLRFEAPGRVLANGKTLTEVPLGQWFHVEIACVLGKDASGVYDMTITRPGEQPQQFRGISCGSAKFRRLEWLGFVSLANGATTFYLDNVKLGLQNGSGLFPAPQRAFGRGGPVDADEDQDAAGDLNPSQTLAE